MNYEKDIKIYIDEILEAMKKKNYNAMMIYILCFITTILMFILFLIQSFNTGVNENVVALTLSFVAIVLVMMQIYFTKQDNSSEKIICLLIFCIYLTLDSRPKYNKYSKYIRENRELYKEILNEIIDIEPK